MKNRIENVKIYTMADRVIYDCGYIEYENGKITAVGPFDGDGTGGVLFPGFIDGHTHIGIIEDSLNFEGDDVNEKTNPVTPQLRAIDCINPRDRCFREAREAGVTCVAAGPGSGNVIGGQFAAIKTVGERIDNMIVKAPVMMKFALGENPKTVYHSKNASPETRMASAALIRGALFEACRYKEKLDKYEREGGDRPGFDMKCESLLPVIRGELTAHFHCHRADDIFTAIRISREFGLKYSIGHCTEGYLIADELAREQVLAFAGPNLTDRSKPELRDQSFANPGILDRHGVQVALITDHPVTPLQYLPLCAAYAVKAGMDEYSALCAITVNPARMLGIADRVGSLEPGKDADMVLLDGSPLEINSRVRRVVIDGVKVFGD